MDQWDHLFALLRRYSALEDVRANARRPTHSSQMLRMHLNRIFRRRE